jgi:signal transduction histidine kinase
VYKRSKERKQVNAQLEQQAAALQNINDIKDKMFSIIGHDLRGPVASLKGLTDMMKYDSLSNADSEMVVKELKQSMNSMDMLLENLLVWAKIQMQGDIISRPVAINLQQLVAENLLIYQKQAQTKQITLQENIDRSLTVIADINYLSLIVRNLINNAIKFTPNNGLVSIDAEYEGTQIKLCVQDNGIGMDAHEIDLLFNLDKPFTKRGTMNERGSGLGLLFVKEYTERCGGRFSISSEKGKGSRFCVTLNMQR